MEHPRIKLAELFSRAKSKLEIISSFLAVLELIRLKEVIVQNGMFGEIEVIRNKENIAPKPAVEDPQTLPQ
jgi:chromatin segregation and condensation protein Rec8/ScpA/Scc1 (kleisin family)